MHSSTQHRYAPRSSPPASYRAIQQIPLISITPEDLAEPVNRECCVCLESYELGQQVVRLPCAHLFHGSCIRDWLLESSCTCPVCRYELPTDDADYEAGRQQRMQERQPRFAKHDLQRLSVKQLQSLLSLAGHSSLVTQSKQKYHLADKSQLIEFLISSKSIEVIPTPPPVTYRFAQLQLMTIPQLKRCMADAGVFYYKHQVVEKDDLIRIFIMSGRLNLIDDDDDDEYYEENLRDQFEGRVCEPCTISASGISVETVANDNGYGKQKKIHCPKKFWSQWMLRRNYPLKKIPQTKDI